MSNWGSGSAYDGYVGRWSRLVAREFIAWLDAAPGARWLDVGCGTGALVEAVLVGTQPAAVTGVDPSPDYIRHALPGFPAEAVSLVAGDGQRLPFASDTFDAIVSGLVLNFMPRPDEGVAEMVRVARPRATVALYVWDYSGGMQMMRKFWDAATALDPAASALDEGSRFSVCHPDRLHEICVNAGLTAVETRPIDVITRFPDFESYWQPFLGGQGPAGRHVVGLAPEDRERLRALLEESLPTASDGAIELTARAWAVRGTAP